MINHLTLILIISIISFSSASPRLQGPPPQGKGVKDDKFGVHHHQPPSFYGGGKRLPYPAPGPPLDFVLEASEKAREGYFKMLAESEDKPKKAIKEAIVKWAEANDLKKIYEESTSEHYKKRKAFHDVVVENLAGKALEAFKKIWVGFCFGVTDITQDDQLTRGEECQQINAVLSELKTKIRHMVPLVSPQISGPPSQRCFEAQEEF
uniref:SXP/RAL-2 family protein Ani s 5-like cation-binding domain-containing protein n=1 Tax=Meloidogyne javanica TaxID=6303 RepID=A0A915LQL2_MELJA